MLKDLSQRISSKPGRNGAANGKASGAANGKANGVVLNGKATLNAPAEETVADTLKEPAVNEPAPKPYKREIVWFNLIGFVIMHIGAVYGGYLFFCRAYFWTDLWGKLYSV